MKLGLTHHLAYNFEDARQAYEEGFALLLRAGEEIGEGLREPAPHPLRNDHLEPSTLDPTLASDAYSVDVIVQLFSGLVTLTPEFEVVPEMAKSWEVLEGGRKYIFHLRDDFFWSDGNPVTAHDFEYAWKRILDPALGSDLAQLLYYFKGARAFHQGEATDPASVGIKALDDMTLELEHEDLVGYALHLLSLGFPVPKHVVEKHGEAWTELDNLVTNGPFRLEEWIPSESMTLTRNPDYPARFPGNVEQVEICLLDLNERLKLYMDGDLDLYWIRQPSIENDRARQQFAGEYLSTPTQITSYVGFHTGRPPFDDPRVRRAFAFAADKVKLADVTLRGFEFPATGGFVPPGLPGHSKEAKLPFDLERARELLKEAGYPNGVGFPSVEFFSGPTCQRAPSLAKQWHENLGVEIKCESFESFDQFTQSLYQEPPHIYTMAWAADYPDPDNFLRTAHFQGLCRWRNETYENLVEEARRISDQDKRMKMYQEAERILVEEVPIIPLTYPRFHVLVKPWVKKFRAVGAVRAWYKEIIIKPH